MEAKKQIRQRHLIQRSAMSEEETCCRSEDICRKMMDSSVGLNQLKRWGCYGYYPLRQEVSLFPIYELLLEQNIPLAFPRVHKQDMDFYQVSSMADFAAGSFGVNEPITECPKVFFEHAVCFVPGLVFDRAGNRYGYGKGYYDRYFAAHRSVKRIGIAYDAQIETDIPAGETDIPMQFLVSESGFWELENR